VTVTRSARIRTTSTTAKLSKGEDTTKGDDR